MLICFLINALKPRNFPYILWRTVLRKSLSLGSSLSKSSNNCRGKKMIKSYRNIHFTIIYLLTRKTLLTVFKIFKKIKINTLNKTENNFTILWQTRITIIFWKLWKWEHNDHKNDIIVVVLIDTLEKEKNCLVKCV